MNLHLIGGFLGSGKTTAIIHAAKFLLTQGHRVGIISNDQGRYLVDTAFFRSANLPTVEVTGGCFCCNYDNFETVIKQLEIAAQPDVIFAESVGSCADIIATVVKPLQAFSHLNMHVNSLSVFADCRLLRRRLSSQPLPFNDHVSYIFDKQIEEAEWLVINKIDLLPSHEAQDLCLQAQKQFPSKRIFTQTSLTPAGVQPWVVSLSTATFCPGLSLNIDYDRYGAGEAALAWLNDEIDIQTTPGEGRQTIICFLETLLEGIEQKNATIGHLKAWIKADDCQLKISVPTLEQPNWQNDIPYFESGRFTVLINARIQTSTEILEELMAQSIEVVRWTTRAICTVEKSELFQPSYPKPRYQM